VLEVEENEEGVIGMDETYIEGPEGPTEFERLLEIKTARDNLKKSRDEATAAQRDELLRLQDEIKALEEPYLNHIKELEDEEGAIRQRFIDLWCSDFGKQIEDEATGIKVTLKTRATPEVLDEKALLTQAVTFDELPIKKISWDNTILKSLITAGVVKKETARITESYEIAVTFPKEA
jgi:hypothetical protein